MIRNRRIALPLLAAAALLMLTVALSACGYSDTTRNVSEGEVVKIGDLKYTVSFSRYLNPNDNEDKAYLVGMEPAPKGMNYFGVFFEVQNQTSETQTLASSLTITDATDATYTVLPSESLYAMPLGTTVEEHEQSPVLDSSAQQDPVQSTVAIFMLPEEVSSNRPLLLHIPGPNGEVGTVKLDL